ncbi:MAG: hypothetical protein AB7O94_22420, partial [Hyphomicrobiaceae bacterium]
AHPIFDPKADLERFYVHDENGHAYIVHHDPIEKFRVMLPLEERLVMTELGIGSRRSINAYKSIYHGVGQALGLKYDHACEDPSRLHYFPSVRKGEEGNYQARVCGTTAKLLNVKDYPRVEVKDEESRTKPRREGPQSHTVTDKDGATISLDKLDRDFDVEGLLTECLDDDMIKADRAGKEGFHITCPFEDNHSSTGGLGTFCANGDGDRSWTIFCSHNSCHGHDRYDYLAEYIRQGFVTADDLGLKPEPVIAIDNEGQGIDCAAYAKATGDDRTAIELAAAIENGDVTAAQLIDTALAAEVPDTDPYKQALRQLARETSSLSAKEIADRKTKIGAEHHAKAGVVNTDYKSALATVEARKTEMGLLSEKEVKKSATATETETKPADMTYDVQDDSRKLAIDNWKHNPISHGSLARTVMAYVAQREAEDPKLFDQGGELVQLQVDKRIGETTAVPVTQAMLRTTIDGYCNFRRVYKKNGAVVYEHEACPRDVAEHAYNLPDKGLLYLLGIATAPFYDKDGNRVDQPGYHRASGYYLAMPEGFSMPPVPDEPTEADVRQARDNLDDVLCDFPFDDDAASKATVIAKLVQPFVREMIDGPCPLYVTQKPQARTGASLLVDVVSLIAFGIETRAMTEKASDEEYDKVIVTLLKECARHIVFDNVSERLDSAPVAQLITSTIYRGRELGSSRSIAERVTQLVEVAGNNIQLSDELRERSLLTVLNARCERPQDRSGFRHPELKPYVKQRRGVLVWSILVLVQNWIAKGRPAFSGKSLGAFESYCRIVGGILEAVGIEGFMANRDKLAESTGDADGGLKEFVQLWWNQFGGNQVPIGMLAFDATAAEYEKSDTHDPKKVETLAELLLVNLNDVSIDDFMRQATKQPKASFASMRKESWNRNLAATITFARDRVFALKGGTVVTVKYGKQGGVNRAQLVRS